MILLWSQYPNNVINPVAVIDGQVKVVLMCVVCQQRYSGMNNIKKVEITEETKRYIKEQ